MAYPYRSPYGSRDESYTNSTNRLGGIGGNMGSAGDSKSSGLMRRFTTNALPMLSPIGQQRRQAAGDPNMVSTNLPSCVASAGMVAGSGGTGQVGDLEEGTMVVGNHSFPPGIRDLVASSEPSPGKGDRPGGSGGQGEVFVVGQERLQWLDVTATTGRGSMRCSSENVQMYRLTPEDQSGLLNRATPSERKIRHIEQLLEQQRTIAAELEKIDDETRREVEQGLRHERAVSDMIAQSEPTTPPSEYQDKVPDVMPRPSRYSSNSLTSPPGTASKSNRGSGQLTSPPTTVRPYTIATAPASNLPSQSVPGSRRHSDDEEEDVLFYDTGIHRAAAKPNRNSMPVSTYDRRRNTFDRRSLNNSSFFDEEEPSALPKTSNKTSPQDTKTYLQVQHTADGFPKLIRREDNGELVTGSSAALDLAFAQASNGEKHTAERGTGSRHRISLPPSALSSNGSIAPLNSILANSNDPKAAANSRRSLEVKFSNETKRPSLMASPPRGMANGMPKTQSSYSTNDIPTLKSIDGETSGGVPITSPSVHPSVIDETASQDPSYVNIDRDSSVANASEVQRADLNGAANLNQQNLDLLNSLQSLQGAASPFGSVHLPDQNQLHSLQSPTMPYSQAAYYGGYGINMLNNGLNNMNLAGGYGIQNQWPGQMAPYQQMSYPGYQQFPTNGQVGAGAGRFPENHRAQTQQQRKAQTDEYYNSISLPDIVGQVYGLCKDQHGCRFLQKKLDERNEKDLQIIFDEVKDHFQELMIDPFGNYLCQRLLEHANDEQRTVLVKNAQSAMTTIALNQHGTRALQRMIESISTQEQTNMVIEALRWDVVQLIQDLNGNHVIQKCLNHLSSQDAQFIFDAVGANCVTVGTHRHGCCVLQRCVDHASGLQKGAMVDHIIANAFALVQDPFGNYVVQYILDLSEPVFTEPLCQSFGGNVAFLSKQKFSSNVIEKCIRCAPQGTKRLLIVEIMNPQDLDRLLRDSFANYVVQTAMEFADDELKVELFDRIRPLLGSIRNTPHGRRIQSKVQEYDAAIAGAGSSNTLSPESTSPLHSTPSTMSFASPPMSARNHRMGMVGAPPQWQTNGFGGQAAAGAFANPGIVHPTPQRNQGYNNFLNGSQDYSNQGFGGQNGYQNFSRPSYGHF